MPSKPRPDLVVFTDLDGTLLAHHDYSWGPASEALEALRLGGIPLVFTSSKTRGELEGWRARLGNADPYISENGGALWFPAGWPGPVPPDAERVEGGWRVGLGVPYPALRQALPRIGSRLGVSLRGFGDMAPSEIAERTGVTGPALEEMMRRDYDEPFVPARPLTPEEEAALDRLAGEAGLGITRGGRFHHLLGNCSKGAAAGRLIALLGEPRSVALGDAENDLDLLQRADQAIVVARPDGTHAPRLKAALPGAIFTREPGPAGFAEGIFAVLEGR